MGFMKGYGLYAWPGSNCSHMFFATKNPWSIFLVWKLSMERQDQVSSNKSLKKKKTQSETKCASKGRFQKLSQSEYLTCYLQHLSHCDRVHASRAWSHSLALSNQPWPGVESWIVPHWDDQKNCFHWNTCQQHMSELWKWIPPKKKRLEPKFRKFSSWYHVKKVESPKVNLFDMRPKRLQALSVQQIPPPCHAQLSLSCRWNDGIRLPLGHRL